MQTSTNIPIFPLPLVAFPGEIVPLHIFEERYQEMITFCRTAKEHSQFHGFGLVQEHDNRVFETGCIMEINKIVREYGDGCLDILTVGVQRFTIEKIVNERSYYTASIRFWEDRDEVVDSSIKAAVVQAYQSLLELMSQDADYASKLPPHPVEDATAFQLGAALGLELRTKQRLLEMDSENKRLEVLKAHMERLAPALAAQVEKRRKATKNNPKVEGNGHLNGHLN